MTKHYEELDSLRGLCALTVIWCHFLGSYPPDTSWLWIFMNTPLAVLRGGNEGVIFFFLLSGFVLSFSFLSEKKKPLYFPYLVKRIFRLYPAYLVAVFAAFLVKMAFLNGPIPGYSDNWINAQWTHPATWKILADHLPLVTRFRTSYLNPPVWSLVVEMRISLVFPVLIFLFLRFRSRALWAFAVISILSGYASYYLKDNSGNKDLQSLLSTSSFLCFFILGAYLAHARKNLTQRLLSLGAFQRHALVAAGLLLYTNDLWISCRWIAAVIPQTVLLNKPPLTNFITGIGASIILVWAISVSSFLSHKLVHFFGKISYSMYLWHMVALYGCIATLHARLPIWQVLLLALAGTIVLSTLSFYYIELPTMRLGRKLSDRLTLWLGRRRVQANAVEVALKP
jgi:peptidoglycan/LPS O-acetylase OafA/YrhL